MYIFLLKIVQHHVNPGDVNQAKPVHMMWLHCVCTGFSLASVQEDIVKWGFSKEKGKDASFYREKEKERTLKMYCKNSRYILTKIIK